MRRNANSRSTAASADASRCVSTGSKTLFMIYFPYVKGVTYTLNAPPQPLCLFFRFRGCSDASGPLIASQGRGQTLAATMNDGDLDLRRKEVQEGLPPLLK